ncbi:MAG TPA: type II secretion system secretin GspD [Pseudobdellovibrionaceae bacterium]|nr:type II secretion system secretin GspD [Pseudobdellovibrionaceae bacterium]
MAMTRTSSKAVAPTSSPKVRQVSGYKQWLALLICTSLVTSSWPAYGQQDELDKLFEDEEIDEPIGTFNQAPPPPPPPAPDFNVDNNPPPPEPTYNTGGGSNVSRGSSGPSTMTVTKTNKPGEKPQNPSIEDITDENYGDLIEANFPDVEINELVKAMGLLTNKNFIIDPGVRGKITILAPNKVTVAEAYKAFLAALAINGFTVVPYGKFYKIKSSRNAQRDSIETYTGEYAPTSDIYITRIVHLKHTSAEEVNKRLRVLPSKDGEITPYEPTNSLIITDYGANVERMIKIIKELDRPGFEEQLAVVPVRYAKSKDLADLINQIINKTPGSTANQNPAFGAAVPRFRSRGGTAAGGTPEELSLVAPDDRTNALIVVGNKAGIDKVRELIRKLDYKLDPAEAGGVFVYYVRYGEAEKIAATISNLSGSAGGNTAQQAIQPPGVFGARPASPLDRQNIFGGDVRIVADKNTNSLVITASKQDYEVVRSLLAKIDIPRDQVFVEAIIMEMNTDKTKAWNPTYYYLDPASGGIGRAGFSRRGTLQNILNPTTDSGAILGFGSGATLNFNVGGQTVKVPSLVSFINLLQQNVESNILSTPKIMALDNEEAVIEVGDNVPIAQDQATTGQTITTNTRFEKATIKLTLTPYIRPDSDVVRLKLEQSVKQPSNTNIRSARLAESTTIISDRFIKTNIVVNSADTAVLGGLIRDEDTVDETKIPVLGDVPVLGWLFKSRSVQKKKINLVIFITPRIIRGVGDSQRLLGEKANERIDWVKRNFDGRDPYGAAMDRLPRTSKTDSDRDFPKKTNTDEPVGVKR